MIQRMLACITLAVLMSTAHAVAPDIALQELDSRPRNVNEIIGRDKWVIVVLWAHDCSICASEIHRMNAFHATHKDKDAIVLGVTIDGVARLDLARRFAVTHKLQFMNLVTEPEAEIVERFGGGKFVGTPTHY
ncbi:MAG: redoxin domain-containing protein, partial [Burkholderiales bacterium]|nr:redoxin domain-containing protein [Burkholderiales bacterium]